MSPYKHSLSSAKKWGGNYQAYLPIHEFLDSTKLHLATWQHRAILHNTFGVGLCERVFGPIIYIGQGEAVEVRYIAIKHIEEDCGGIVPTIKDWVEGIQPRKFMMNMKTERKELNILEEELTTKNNKYDSVSNFD